MQAAQIIVDTQRLLAEWFARLRDSRTGPVFFIEHGRSEADTEDLRQGVSRAARLYPLQDGWWRTNPLPLVVTATEIGYRYRGTGTDFWPKLESALGIHISLESRREVRDLFKRCSSKYRGARPPVTPWTRYFCLIAWPVTHALVPLEFHRQLSATLANLRSDVEALDDEELHRAVRSATRQPSARFESFLEDGSHAVPVIRALLGGQGGEVSQDTVTRIDLDLKADRDARIDIEIARRKQRQLRTGPTSRPKPTPREVLPGRLQLRLRDGGGLIVEAAFPTIQGSEVDQLRRTLRRRRQRIQLWGLASPVPSDCLLSGLPFPVNLRAVPAVGTPLLEGLDQLGIDSRLMRILASFQLEFHPPMVFAANSEGDLACLIQGREISAFRKCWLLAVEEAGGPFARLPKLGGTGPFACYRLDPLQAQAAEALDRLGYRVHHNVSVSIAGAPPLDERGGVPRFLVGDQRVVVPRRQHPPGSAVEVGGERVALDGDLVRIRVSSGEHILEISSQGALRRDPFKGVQAVERGLYRPCWIELSSDERTVQALLGGGIALRIDGLAPLEGLTLTLELEVGGWRAGTSVLLDPLPHALPADQEPWPTLLNQATHDRILNAPGPVVLHARIGALAAESWTFERSVRPCWWTRNPSGLLLNSEMGPLDYGEVSSAAPAAQPVPAIPGDRADAVLLVPLDADEAVFGPTAGFATFCTGPVRTALLAPRMDRPRLRRSRRGVGGSLGMEDLAEAWLRWSLAESDTLTAEIRRRQVSAQLDRWLAELACGQVWTQREERIRVPVADPWKLLAEECVKSRLGLDELVELSERDEAEVLGLAVKDMRRSRPDLWVRIGPHAVQAGDVGNSLLDAEDYADLDGSCARAYEQLAVRLRKAGKNEFADVVEAADPGAGPDRWDPVLEKALAGSELRELGELLLPTDTAQRLMSLDLTLMPLGEITEELLFWARESRKALAGDLPSSETLQAILALWVAPETAVSLDWRNTLDTLVAERSLARAARYLALRARSVRPTDSSP